MTDKCETSSLFARPYEIRDGCRLSLAQLEQNECLYVLPLYREMCVCVCQLTFVHSIGFSLCNSSVLIL